MAVVAPPPRSPEDQGLQALIEEARRRARRRRRRNSVAVVIAVIAAGALCALVVHAASHGARSAVVTGERAAGSQPYRLAQFWYTRATSSLHQWMPAGGSTFDHRGYAHRHGPEVLFDVRLTEETWVGDDGTMRDRVTASPRFATAAGRATWTRYGRPVPTNFNVSGWLAHDAITVGGGRFPPQLYYPWGEGLGPYGLDLGDGLLTYRHLVSLPRDPSALLASLGQAETSLMRRGDTGYETQPGALRELTDIGGLIASPVPGAERLALLRAAERLPGVEVRPHASDVFGRRGVSITATTGIAMQRLIFDPATGALLEGPKGAILAQGVVNSPYALPKGTAPVRVAGGPPVPALLAIAPPIANPTTVLRVTLTHATGHKAPALDWVLAGTPGEQCFPRGFPRPLRAFATARDAYTYELGPAQLGRQTWCPGHYELQVVPDYGPTARDWRPGMPGPTFSSGIGTSAYFDVK
jgi:hypothetical protein